MGLKSREREARTVLKRLGVSQSINIRLGPMLWLAILLAVSVMFQIHDHIRVGSLRLAPLATPVATLGAVFLALHQYMQQRNESTIGGALGRLDIVNSYYRSADAAKVLGPLFRDANEVRWADGLAEDAAWQQRMYVFLELDNLQYGLERFRLGHSTAYQAVRTLDLFCARCQSRTFLAIAQELVGKAVGSYTRETRDVVGRLRAGYRPLAEVDTR